jgi:antirestriction protein ArdC
VQRIDRQGHVFPPRAVAGSHVDADRAGDRHALNVPCPSGVKHAAQSPKQGRELERTIACGGAHDACHGGVGQVDDPGDVVALAERDERSAVADVDLLHDRACADRAGDDSRYLRRVVGAVPAVRGSVPQPAGPGPPEATMPTSTLTEEERQARREADRQRTRDAVEALRASDGWQQWLRLRRHFHNYSLTNQLLIAIAMPDATRVAGFKAWLKLGYSVRRRERAVIRIWMPLPPSKKQLDAWHAAGADPTERPRTRFRLGPVWDRSQVEPLPPPAEPVALDPPITEPDGDSLGWAVQQLKALVNELGCTLVFEDYHTDLGGFFAPSTKTISINSAHAVNHQVKTLIHELAHALIHCTATDGPELSYAEEEIVVESIAFIVVGGLGIDTSGYSIPYLTSWSQDDADIETVEACAELIDRHARRIENAIGDPPGPTATSETTEPRAPAARDPRDPRL